jgi:hypothetical protein
VCFQLETEAIYFKEAMEIRLKEFNLEVAHEKPKLFEFGVFAQSKAKARGERAATFDFLGFTHYNSRSRDGKRYRMKRKTVSKRLIAKVVAYKEWLKANRTLPTAQIMKTTAAKLRGHFAYYGVTDNSKSMQSFAYWVMKTLYKWLNRRGKRGCYTWEKFNKLLTLYPLPNRRSTVNLLSASR